MLFEIDGHDYQQIEKALLSSKKFSGNQFVLSLIPLKEKVYHLWKIRLNGIIKLQI